MKQILVDFEGDYNVKLYISIYVHRLLRQLWSDFEKQFYFKKYKRISPSIAERFWWQFSYIWGSRLQLAIVYANFYNKNI